MNIRRSGRLAIALILLLAPLASFAEIDSGFFADVTDRFRPYEPNYAIWQYTDNDDDAMEARFSFKYLFTNPEASPSARSRQLQAASGNTTEQKSRTEIFVKYTGEFDFYWGSRFSAPVVNRASNPGIHYRKYADAPSAADIITWSYIDIGLQHLSNGQTQDPNLIRDGQTRAQAFYDIDPHSPYFDTISRSVNFLSIESSFQFGKKNGGGAGLTNDCTHLLSCYNVRLRLIPWYIDDDNPVTWGPDGGRRSRVAEYDRLHAVFSKQTKFGDRFLTEKKFGFPEMEVGLEWTVGDDLFETDSFDAYIFLPLQINDNWRLPFYVRYHNGPMNNLSNFTTKQNSIGIGLRLF